MKLVKGVNINETCTISFPYADSNSGMLPKKKKKVTQHKNYK